MLTSDQIVPGTLIRCVVEGEWFGKIANITTHLLDDDSNLFRLQFLNPDFRQVRIGFPNEFEVVEP